MKKYQVLFIIINLFLPLLCYSLKNVEMKVLLTEKEDDENYQFYYAKDYIVDNNLNIYIVDMKGCVVKKYDKNGKYILAFGRRGEGPGELNSPYGIALSGGKIYIPQYTRLDVFSDQGIFEKTVSYPMKIQVFKLRIINNEIAIINGAIDDKVQLITFPITVLKPKIKRLASIDIPEHKSGVVAIKDNILFDTTNNNEIVYASNNEIKVNKYSFLDNTIKKIIESDYNKEIYSESTIKKMLEQRKKFPKLSQIPIPEYYDLLNQLIVDDYDNVWLYIKSKEKTGFFKYDKNGKYINDYNLLLPGLKFEGGGRIIIRKDRIFLFHNSREEGVKLYFGSLK